MSHFTVLVRLPADTLLTSKAINDAIQHQLIPFKERGCGMDDPPELEEFLTFKDCEDEWRQEFAALSEEDREDYPTFEVFARDYYGKDAPDEKTGRYGYWKNPNQKWDWFEIGGRWRNKLLLTDGDAAVARISDLDFAKAAAQAAIRARKFYAEYQDLANGKEWSIFEGPRETALKLGLLDVKDESELTGEEWRVRPWRNGETRVDVLSPVTLDEVMLNYQAFFNPLTTYARVENRKWVACGEMGWFGFSDSESGSLLAYYQDFLTWLTSGNQDDIVVVVDCHI